MVNLKINKRAASLNHTVKEEMKALKPILKNYFSLKLTLCFLNLYLWNTFLILAFFLFFFFCKYCYKSAVI